MNGSADNRLSHAPDCTIFTSAQATPWCNCHVEMPQIVQRPTPQKSMNDLRAKLAKDHPPMPVLGFTGQPQSKVDLVNDNKIAEEKILRVIDKLQIEAGSGGPIDGRCLALARTSMQEAFMWLNRAVFQPQRIKLPGDDDQSNQLDLFPHTV